MYVCVCVYYTRHSARERASERASERVARASVCLVSLCLVSMSCISLSCISLPCISLSCISVESESESRADFLDCGDSASEERVRDSRSGQCWSDHDCHASPEGKQRAPDCGMQVPFSSSSSSFSIRDWRRFAIFFFQPKKKGNIELLLEVTETEACRGQRDRGLQTCGL